MNNIKTNIIGAVAILAFLGVAFLFADRPASSPQSFGGTPSTTVVPPAGAALSDGTILPNPTTYDYLVSRVYLSAQNAFGLGNSTSVPTNYEAIRMSLTSATSTPCALLNPLNATSTITSFSMNVTTATSSAITWDVGTSTTQYATSTSMLNAVSIGASQQFTMTWDGGTNNSLIGPGKYIVVGPDAATLAATGAFNSIVIGGSCQATFQTVI